MSVLKKSAARLELERDTLLEEGVSETRRQQLKTSISALSEDYKKAAESVQGAHDRLVGLHGRGRDTRRAVAPSTCGAGASAG
jgi:hypothetical protein